MKIIVAVTASLFLASCATGSNIATESCQQLGIDYAANTEQAFSIITSTRSGRGAANDLVDRNVSIKELAERKGCKTLLWPDQPAR